MLIRFLDWMIGLWWKLKGRPDNWPLDDETIAAMSKLDPDDIDPIVVADAMKVTIKHAVWLCDTAVRQGLFERHGDKRYALHVNEANVLRAPDVEDCPDFTLPAHFTFDPHNKEEQAEIQRRALKHMHWCTRCDPGMSERERLARNYIEKREELRDKVIKAVKLWRKYRIGANEVELEWAVRDLDEYESEHR